MNEYTISVTLEESSYILSALKLELYNLIICFTDIDKCLDIWEMCISKDKVLKFLTEKEIRVLKSNNYFKKLDLYLKLRKKVLGF